MRKPSPFVRLRFWPLGLAALLFARSALAQETEIELDLRFKFSPDNPDYSTLRREQVPDDTPLLYEDGSPEGRKLKDFAQSVMVGHMRVKEKISGKDFCGAIDKAKEKFGDGDGQKKPYDGRVHAFDCLNDTRMFQNPYFKGESTCGSKDPADKEIQGYIVNGPGGSCGVGKVPGGMKPCTCGKDAPTSRAEPARKSELLARARRALLRLFGLLGPKAAVATPPPAFYCYPLASLLRQVGSCSSNTLFAQAASQCLTRIDADAARAAAPLDELVRAGKAAGPDAEARQTTMFGHHEQNLAEARRELERVRGDAVTALGDLDYYQKVLVWPGPMDGSSPAELFDNLMGEGCYGDNQRQLQEALQSMSRKIAQLDGALATAARLDGSSARSRTELGGTAGERSVQGGAPGAPVPSGTAPRHESTITGKVRPSD